MQSYLRSVTFGYSDAPLTARFWADSDIAEESTPAKAFAEAAGHGEQE